VHDDLLSIGALARAGGLTVSALRFYDAAGVLRPAYVDPVTGYRRYTSAQVHTASLVASLRQAGLPVVDLVAVLAAPADAPELLERHRRRLEEDLAAAGEHLDAAADLLAEPGRCEVAADDLLAAFGAVRSAVGGDPVWPGLAGVLLHLDGTTLRLVGCDRRRLAVATVPVRRPSGPEVRALVPLALLDEVAAAQVPDIGPVVLGARLLEILGVRGEPLDAAYPDYEGLLLSGRSRGATVTTDEIVEGVEGAGGVVAVRLDGDRVELAAPGAPDAVGFSRTFLLDAVRAARAERLALALDDARSVLSVSAADRPGDTSLVMPILLRRPDA
jgi:DNA-binding transcriptional MerR regulator